MKRFVEGADRGQSTLLPECLDDWIDESNPVRVIDAFVDALDLAELGFDGVEPAATGRPCLSSFGSLEALHLRLSQPRAVEPAAGARGGSQSRSDVAARPARPRPQDDRRFPQGQRPGDSARCARASSSCAARWVCSRRRASPSTAASSRRSTIATGTSRARRWSGGVRSSRRASRAISSQLDTADRQEPSEALAVKTTQLKEKLAKLKEEMGKLAAYEKQMLASPDQQISLTDPDSRSMATSGRGSGVVGYNVQVAVDTEHHLIVTHEVTNIGSDRAQLANVAKQAKAVLQVDTLEAVADRGYFNGPEILACDEAGITVTLPKPMTSGAKSEGRFGKQDFVYLAERGCLSLSGRRAPDVPLHERGRWQRCCGATGRRHARTARSNRNARQARSDASRDGSTSTCSRPCSSGSTRTRSHAPAARDGRASVRHDQGAHGRDALPDEDAAEGRQPRWRSRARLQSDARDEHRRHQAADGGASGREAHLASASGSVRVRSGCPGRPQIKNLFETIAWRHPHGRRSPKTPPARYHTTKTHKRHAATLSVCYPLRRSKDHLGKCRSKGLAR